MTTQPAIRVLLSGLAADDAHFVRASLAEEPWSIVGEVEGGTAVLERAESLRPHVLLLGGARDPEMFPSLVQDLRPLRRLSVVLLTSASAPAPPFPCFEALRAGARQVIALPRGEEPRLRFTRELRESLPELLGGDAPNELPPTSRRFDAEPTPPACVVMAGGAAGLPELAELLGELQGTQPPLLAALSLPAGFGAPLVEWLQRRTNLTVKPAEAHETPRPNHLYLAAADRHLMLRRCGALGKLFLRDGEPVHGRKPSADVLLRSAADILGPRLVGTLLPGRGADGRAGCRAIEAAGGRVVPPRRLATLLAEAAPSGSRREGVIRHAASHC